MRTGSGEAVQGLFPAFFVFLFLSSMAIPRNLMSVDWFRWFATVNPVSYLIEGVRSLIVVGWDARGARARVRRRGRDRRDRDRARRVVAAAEAGAAREDARGRRGRRVADAAQLLHEQGAADPVDRVPALLLHRVRGRARRDLERAGLRLPRRLHRVPVRVRAAAVGGVRGRLHRASGSRATSSRASRAGCCSPRRTAAGSCSATRSRASSAGWWSRRC